MKFDKRTRLMLPGAHAGAVPRCGEEADRESSLAVSTRRFLFAGVELSTAPCESALSAFRPTVDAGPGSPSPAGAPDLRTICARPMSARTARLRSVVSSVSDAGQSIMSAQVMHPGRSSCYTSMMRTVAVSLAWHPDMTTWSRTLLRLWSAFGRAVCLEAKDALWLSFA